jgi:hypothetical protein
MKASQARGKRKRKRAKPESEGFTRSAKDWALLIDLDGV